MPKILIIRFSSIGDIVLTTPVIRCAKNQIHDAEIHFLVKKGFETIIDGNANIDRVHIFQGNLSDTINNLKKHGFDIVIDLQKNLKSRWISFRLNAKTYTFEKLNFRKWLLTSFKINTLPDKHIIDRYFDGVKTLGISNDGKGLDFIISQEHNVSIKPLLPKDKQYVCLILGATHFTKRIPDKVCQRLISQSTHHVMLLGGNDVALLSKELHESFPNQTTNLSGKLTLHESAAVINGSRYTITADTGMMHIAAALDAKIHVLWGNTVPEFGMYPYLNSDAFGKYISHEVKGLSCRPCSKLGSQNCPKGHHRCMMDQDIDSIK